MLQKIQGSPTRPPGRPIEGIISGSDKYYSPTRLSHYSGAPYLYWGEKEYLGPTAFYGDLVAGPSPHPAKTLEPETAPMPRHTDWLSGLQASLDELGSLAEGWDGYSAPPPSSRAIILSEVFLDALHAHDLRPTRLAPSVVGGIAFTFTRLEREAFVEFYSDGQICAMFSLLSAPDEEPAIALVPQERDAFRRLADDIKAFLYG